MTTTSALVQRAIIATASEMDGDVELFGVPVDLPGRAVVFVTAPIRLVVKVDTDWKRIERESKALKQLDGIAPTARHWFAVEPDDPDQASVLAASYLDGERFSDSTPDEPWRDLGRHLFGIHQADQSQWGVHPSDPSAANNWATQLSIQARDSGMIDEQIATAFLTQTISESPGGREPCLIHGDLTPDHAFFDREAVSGLIDLGDCGRGDPAYDLAAATLWNPEKLTLVLEGYTEAGGRLSDTPELAIDISRFQLMRLLAGALWLHKYEFNTAPYVGELYQRLLDGLPNG